MGDISEILLRFATASDYGSLDTKILDIQQLRLICLRALANISNICNQSQLQSLWRFICTPDGAFVVYDFN